MPWLWWPFPGRVSSKVYSCVQGSAIVKVLVWRKESPSHGLVWVLVVLVAERIWVVEVEGKRWVLQSTITSLTPAELQVVGALLLSVVRSGPTFPQLNIYWALL